MPAAVEEKSMVPTVLVGIGGTGNEILSRLRRLIEESYGSLSNFPIVSFLVVDTDKDYKISNPEAAGSAFKDNEKHWARVSGKQVQEMVSDMDRYPLAVYLCLEIPKIVGKIKGVGEVGVWGGGVGEASWGGVSFRP